MRIFRDFRHFCNVLNKLKVLIIASAIQNNFFVGWYVQGIVPLSILMSGVDLTPSGPTGLDK
jgi:hypothetical protein